MEREESRQEASENDGDLKLTNMSDGVYEVYKVLEFYWFLKAYHTLNEAISAFDEEVEHLIDSAALAQDSKAWPTCKIISHGFTRSAQPKEGLFFMQESTCNTLECVDKR